MVHARLVAGKPTSYAELMEYQTCRIIWHADGATQCSCPSYGSGLGLRCLHTLAFDLAAGMDLPESMDNTPLMAGAHGRRGRRPKVGNCYSTAVVGEEKYDENKADLSSIMHWLEDYKDNGDLLLVPLANSRARNTALLNKANQVHKRPAANSSQMLPLTFWSGSGFATSDVSVKRRRLNYKQPLVIEAPQEAKIAKSSLVQAGSVRRVMLQGWTCSLLGRRIGEVLAKPRWFNNPRCQAVAPNGCQAGSTCGLFAVNHLLSVLEKDTVIDKKRMDEIADGDCDE